MEVDDDVVSTEDNAANDGSWMAMKATWAGSKTGTPQKGSRITQSGKPVKKKSNLGKKG